MEGLFKTENGAPMVIMGQPDEEHQRIDNPLVVNNVLSFLIYGTTKAEVKGLDDFRETSGPRLSRCSTTAITSWPDWGRSSSPSWSPRRSCCGARSFIESRWLLWIMMLCLPLPYIANTAGWMTAELGRQPWLVYGLMRTSEGYSKYVQPATDCLRCSASWDFTAAGHPFLVLVYREIAQRPGRCH